MARPKTVKTVDKAANTPSTPKIKQNLYRTSTPAKPNKPVRLSFTGRTEERNNNKRAEKVVGKKDESVFTAEKPRYMRSIKHNRRDTQETKTLRKAEKIPIAKKEQTTPTTPKIYKQTKTERLQSVLLISIGQFFIIFIYSIQNSFFMGRSITKTSPSC